MLSISKIKYSHISLVCFFVIVFILTRQVPFKNLSILSNLSLLILLIANFPKEKTFIIFSFIILCLTGYSIINENVYGFIFRFLIILWSICACYYIKLNEKAIKILFIFTFLQCFVIIGFEIFILFFSNDTLNSGIRTFFLNKGWGDIYTLNGVYYKIQILGNAILPFVYMLSFVYPIFPSKYTLIYRIIFFVSILLSGQFAFLIAIVSFHIYNFYRTVHNNKQLIYSTYLFIVIILSSSIPAYKYVKDTLEMKKDESTAIRIEQTNLLINDLNSNFGTILFGKGIGNTLKKQTHFRDYTDNVYFELQTIYILNQLGIIFFTLFILYNIHLAFKHIKYKELLFIYLFYICYAITNPYIFDTNHIVVILTLSTICNIKNKTKESCQ